MFTFLITHLHLSGAKVISGIHFPSALQSCAIAAPLKALGIKIMWTNTGQGYYHKNRLLIETDNPYNDFLFSNFKNYSLKYGAYSCRSCTIILYYLSQAVYPQLRVLSSTCFIPPGSQPWWAIYANNIYWGLGDLFCFCQDCCALHSMILPQVLSTCSVAAREQLRLPILMGCD